MVDAQVTVFLTSLDMGAYTALGVAVHPKGNKPPMTDYPTAVRWRRDCSPLELADALTSLAQMLREKFPPESPCL